MSSKYKKNRSSKPLTRSKAARRTSIADPPTHGTGRRRDNHRSISRATNRFRRSKRRWTQRRRSSANSVGRGPTASCKNPPASTWRNPMAQTWGSLRSSAASMRASVPSGSSVSGFRINNLSCVASAADRFTPTENPRFAGDSMMRTAGKLLRMAAALSSDDALSKTMTSAAGGKLPMHRNDNSRVL